MITLVDRAVKDLAGTRVAGVASFDTFNVMIGPDFSANVINGTSGCGLAHLTSGADALFGLGGNESRRQGGATC